ncbi:MAG: CRISPR-associated protein Cas4, partial [Bacteroidales bacterium]|nr:CRISPR-associated protein Cas4 [Bacteroidales bacterium]
MSLTPSHIIEYLFCPRFTYFEYVLCIPQYEERHYKVEKGRKLHDLKMVRNKDYLRKKIGVEKKFIDQYLVNELIRGRVDEVLLLDDGTMSPLDYKFAQFKDKIYSTYKTQLYCYAWLIEDNFRTPVKKGFLVYTRSACKLVEIGIGESDKDEVKRAAEGILRIINENFFPQGTRHKEK